MKNKFLKAFLAIVAISTIVACTKDDKWSDFQEFGPNKDVVGEYTVTYYDKSDLTAPLDDPSTLMIYNTATSEDSVWVDDNKHFWQYKVKAKISGGVLSIDKGYDLIWDDSTSIHGTIKDGALNLELEWASDAGTIYVAKGKRKTGF